MSDPERSSRLPGFYRKSLQERVAIVARWANLTDEEQEILLGASGLTATDADNMIENAVGVFALPLGIATNFTINGQDYLVPMAVEEPSVVAATSYAAKLFRENGGFTARSDDPVMIGQIQVLDLPDVSLAAQKVLDNKSRLLEEANQAGGSIVRRGGGSRDVRVKPFVGTAIGDMLIVHILFDTRDAMGANAINTVTEHLAPTIESVTGGRVNLRILSNLTDERKAYATGTIHPSQLATENMSGERVLEAIIEAATLAVVDPYRAATHNKGIMNGIDPIVIATGNDWRAVEAGAHAYAAREGHYTSLTRWWQDENGNLKGSIELPLALGIVGGATRVHPAAKVVLKVLGVETAQQLAEIITTVGLAQNFAALRALATHGIQQGHMRLHARQLAVAAGASGEQIEKVARAMVEEGNIRSQRAEELVQTLNEDGI